MYMVILFQVSIGDMRRIFNLKISDTGIPTNRVTELVEYFDSTLTQLVFHLFITGFKPDYSKGIDVKSSLFQCSVVCPVGVTIYSQNYITHLIHMVGVLP